MEDFTHILPGDKPFYKYEKDRKEKCAFLTLNRPEKRNAVPESADEELVAAIDDWENDDNVKSVIVIGNGKHFCGGHDLGGWGGLDMTSDAPRSERRDPQRVQLTRQIVGRPRTLGRLFLSMKPTIAAVRGVCIEMGNMIQLYCDMTIASETARIGNLGQTIGISGITTARPYISLIGQKRYREMVTTGKLVSGKEAELWGLVNRAVPDDQLEAEVMATVRRIALLPIDGIVTGKAFTALVYSEMGLVASFIEAGFGHSLGAFKLAHEEDEFHFFKTAREEGISAAIGARNQRYREAPISRGLIIGEEAGIGF
ncbi:MAG: enoyl-CoA hydratase/isomerase family protein [Dehalococcoidia bacterium]|jgi:enoyl-CoA hydratase|nr:enoyl-CoA hydratase/isomerase family protein [Dehalococcoidia bacterium]HJN85541.1 enoyl-CoA hydratase/isomerase family protein [Dehalococcoidia bacterium]